MSLRDLFCQAFVNATMEDWHMAEAARTLGPIPTVTESAGHALRVSYP